MYMNHPSIWTKCYSYYVYAMEKVGTLIIPHHKIHLLQKEVRKFK